MRTMPRIANPTKPSFMYTPLRMWEPVRNVLCRASWIAKARWFIRSPWGNISGWQWCLWDITRTRIYPHFVFLPHFLDSRKENSAPWRSSLTFCPSPSLECKQPRSWSLVAILTVVTPHPPLSFLSPLIERPSFECRRLSRRSCQRR